MNQQSPVFNSIGNKGTLVMQVVNQIEQQIVDGKLQPNTKLPTERDMATQLGVSRTVVREAVQILSAKGLLDSQRGIGTIVKALTMNHVTEPMSLFLETHSGGVTFDQLHEVRCVLEISMAGIAATAATDEDLAHIHAIHEAMRTSADLDHEQFASQDSEFHHAIAQATNNPLLLVFQDSLRDLLDKYLSMVIPRLRAQRQVLPYHQAIVDALMVRDAEAAKLAMSDHLDQVKRNHTEAFGE